MIDGVGESGTVGAATGAGTVAGGEVGAVDPQPATSAATRTATSRVRFTSEVRHVVDPAP